MLMQAFGFFVRDISAKNQAGGLSSLPDLGRFSGVFLGKPSQEARGCSRQVQRQPDAKPNTPKSSHYEIFHL